MAVGFRGIIAEIPHHVQADILVLGKVGLFHQFIELPRALHAVCLHADVPGLVVQAGADDVHVLLFPPQGLRYLLVAVLHAVAEAVGGHFSVFVAGPGDHGVGVGIV